MIGGEVSELQTETSKRNLVNLIDLTGLEKTVLNRQNPQNIRMSIHFHVKHPT